MEQTKTEKFEAFETLLGYRFSDIGLLRTALTHSSYVSGDHRANMDNERLEFLGDAVLELCVSDYLFNKNKTMKEGELSRTRARLVCEEALFAAANGLGLPRMLRLGHGMDITGGREKPSIVSDAMEAVIGAIYLDGGIEPARKVIIGRIVGELEKHSVDIDDRDYKTMIQHWAQARHLGDPCYSVPEESGPEHMKTFTAVVSLNGKVLGKGSGKSKQAAGQAAAADALRRIDEMGEESASE